MKHHKREFGTTFHSKSGVAPGHPGVRKAGVPAQDSGASGPPAHWRAHYERTRGPAVQDARTAEDAMQDKNKQGGR